MTDNHCNIMFIYLRLSHQFCHRQIQCVLRVELLITELIKAWCEYLVEAPDALSLLIKQNSRSSQSFHAASWVVKFATTTCVFFYIERLKQKIEVRRSQI